MSLISPKVKPLVNLRSECKLRELCPLQTCVLLVKLVDVVTLAELAKAVTDTELAKAVLFFGVALIREHRMCRILSFRTATSERWSARVCLARSHAAPRPTQYATFSVDARSPPSQGVWIQPNNRSHGWYSRDLYRFYKHGDDDGIVLES